MQTGTIACPGKYLPDWLQVTASASSQLEPCHNSNSSSRSQANMVALMKQDRHCRTGIAGQALKQDRHCRTGTDQVVWVHVAVHADIGPTRSQITHHPARARPEVLEGVLSVDSAFNGMTLQAPMLVLPILRVSKQALRHGLIHLCRSIVRESMSIDLSICLHIHEGMQSRCRSSQTCSNLLAVLLKIMLNG